MKTGRQSTILEIITSQNIETQHQLQAALLERGVKSTQATLSRDIKDMRLIKTLGSDGCYRYAPPPEAESDDSHIRLTRIMRESVKSIDLAMNLIVVKTLPGLGSAVCAAIDSMNNPDVVGSIAGDDTGFIALRSIEDAKRLYDEIKESF